MNVTQINLPVILKTIFILVGVAVILLILNIPIRNRLKREHRLLLVNYKNIHNTTDIAPVDQRYIKPFIYENMNEFQKIATDERKEKFIEVLLPSILIAKYEIFKENRQTINIWGKLKAHYDLTGSDSVFMEQLFQKYETKNFAEINQKQQLHPNSIILAQAALETGWGTSRFFLQGNNAYGIWSFNKMDNRMESLSGRGNVKIYLKKYNTLFESVNDYFLTISKSWAFDQFRKRRAQTDNAYELIWYLNKYSELRNDYVKKIGELLIQNNLTKYDTCELDPQFFINVKI